PLGNPALERFTLRGTLIREELGDIDSERAELVNAWVTSEGDWQRTLSATILRERDILIASSEIVTQLIPGVEWSYPGGETGVRARAALRLVVGFAGSAPALGAPTGYVPARIRTQFMHSRGDTDRLIF